MPPGFPMSSRARMRFTSTPGSTGRPRISICSFQPSAVTAAARALRNAGFVTRLEDQQLLAKATLGEYFVDLIMGWATDCLHRRGLDRAGPYQHPGGDTGANRAGGRADLASPVHQRAPSPRRVGHSSPDPLRRRRPGLEAAGGTHRSELAAAPRPAHDVQLCLPWPPQQRPVVGLRTAARAGAHRAHRGRGGHRLHPGSPHLALQLQHRRARVGLHDPRSELVRQARSHPEVRAIAEADCGTSAARTAGSG